jgi:hypothetical protein
MNHDAIRVLIAVVSYNKRHDTLRCLDSIKKLAFMSYDVFVVDNASTDGTPEEIRRRLPEVQLVETGGNLGASAARNIAIEYALKADYKYILFLDNDAFVDELCLQKLVDFAETDERIGAVGAKVFYYPEVSKIWYFGAKIDWKKGAFVDTCQGEIDDGRFEAIREVDTFPIGFGLVRIEAVLKAGKIDEDYFIYYEETDWQLRIKKFGYKVFVIPTAKIWHHYTSPAGNASRAFYYYRNRNQLLFMYKNSPKRYWLGFLARFVLQFTYSIALTLYLSKKNCELRAAISGVFDFFLGRWGKKVLTSKVVNESRN